MVPVMNIGQIPELSPPQEVNGGGFDHGVHVINRMNYGNLYYEYNSLPKVPVEMQGTDIIESHWANWLAPDDVLQPEVTIKFINYYRQFQRLTNRYIAKILNNFILNGFIKNIQGYTNRIRELLKSIIYS